MAMITLRRRKHGRTNEWLFQVWPDNHSPSLPEPPWHPGGTYSQSIQGAIFIAFLLLGPNEVEVYFTQEEWNGYFKAERRADKLEHELPTNPQVEKPRNEIRLYAVPCGI
jgi:hypothetical protein